MIQMEIVVKADGIKKSWDKKLTTGKKRASLLQSVTSYATKSTFFLNCT